jgi:hypothetical protein
MITLPRVKMNNGKSYKEAQPEIESRRKRAKHVLCLAEAAHHDI